MTSQQQRHVREKRKSRGMEGNYEHERKAGERVGLKHRAERDTKENKLHSVSQQQGE